MRFLPFADLHSEQYATESCEEISPALYEEVQEAGELETMIAERDSVQRCMDQMPETLRVPLLLSVVAGFSSRELAKMLVLNEATVRQRLSRARKAFQCLYARESGEYIQSAEASSRSRSEVSRSRGYLKHLSAALPSVAF
jgi:DNA-directed RNA polymerase specialized sigma24 family protein